jgi:AcrR family transcriptional regulator
MLSERSIETSIRDTELVKRRRDEIIQGARKVFTEKGYHKTTIKDICKITNLGPGTIYNYVKKKEDILFLVYDDLTKLLNETLLEAIKNEREPLDQLKQALIKTIEVVWDNQDLILLLYQETASLDKNSMYHILTRESNYVKKIEQILEKGKEKGVIQNEDFSIAANIVVFLLAFVPLRRWNLLRGKYDENKIKSGLIDFILKGVCAR